MKVKNKTIQHIEIRLNETLGVKEIINKTHNIIGENKDHAVIDDNRFSTLSIVKAKKGFTQFYPLIGSIAVRDYTKDRYFKDVWGAFVIEVYHYGMSKKILQNRINRTVDKYINDKIGCYLIAGRCNIQLK